MLYEYSREEIPTRTIFNFRFRQPIAIVGIFKPKLRQFRFVSWDADENGANSRVFLPSGNKVDVIASGVGEGGRPLALDFRVCYPLQSNAERGTFDAQEREKNEKHKKECGDAGWDFER